jgi:predicted transcriptional regulator
MKNFHLPLPHETYAHLRALAERLHTPATILARQAIDEWLREQLRNERKQAIAAYAQDMAGTDMDLDSDLESAAVEQLLKASR